MKSCHGEIEYDVGVKAKAQAAFKRKPRANQRNQDQSASQGQMTYRNTQEPLMLLCPTGLQAAILMAHSMKQLPTELMVPKSRLKCFRMYENLQRVYVWCSPKGSTMKYLLGFFLLRASMISCITSPAQNRNPSYLIHILFKKATALFL